MLQDSANDSTNVARAHFARLLATHSCKSVQFLDFCLLAAAVPMNNCCVHTFAQGASMDASYSNTTCVVGEIQTCDEHLWSSIQLHGSRNVLDDAVQKVIYAVGRRLPILTHPSILGRAVDDREIQLLFSSIQIAHQIENHLVNFFRPAIRFVNFVDYHDGL